MAAVTTHNDLGVRENKIYQCFHFFPSICHEVMGLDTMILVFWIWSSSQLFHSLHSFSSRGSLFPFHFLPLEWYHLRLLIFLPAILILPCDSSRLAFCMMYSAYKLNKQGDNIQPCLTPFQILNQSVVSCPVLTVVSWPEQKFLRREVMKSCMPICLRIFHSLLWSTQSKSFAQSMKQFSSVQLLSHVRLFVTPWIAARQTSLSITNSQSSLKTHFHWVSDAIQPSHPLPSPSPPAPNPSQHQSLFQWVSSLHEVAKVLEFQL